MKIKAFLSIRKRQTGRQAQLVYIFPHITHGKTMGIYKWIMFEFIAVGTWDVSQICVFINYLNNKNHT